LKTALPGNFDYPVILIIQREYELQGSDEMESIPTSEMYLKQGQQIRKEDLKKIMGISMKNYEEAVAIFPANGYNVCATFMLDVQLSCILLQHRRKVRGRQQPATAYT